MAGLIRVDIISPYIETLCHINTESFRNEPRPVQIAVLDFDGTIIDGQSGSQLVWWLMGKQRIKLSSIVKIGWWGARYKLHLPCEQSDVREEIFEMFKDDPIQQVNDLMHAFHDECLIPMYKKRAQEVIEKLRDQGFYTIIISASFISVVMPAAERLGVHALLATRMELNEDHTRFTGKVYGVPVEGKEKVTALQRFANEKFGIGNWEIACAYGDHHSDKYLLERARYACAVDPDSSLERKARKNQWSIVSWK